MRLFIFLQHGFIRSKHTHNNDDDGKMSQENCPFIKKAPLQKYDERQPELDARNVEYLLRQKKDSRRTVFAIANVFYLCIAVMIFVMGDSNLTTYHAWLSGGMYSRLACLYGTIVICLSMIGIYASMNFYAKGRYYALLYVFFMVFVIVTSFIVGSAGLIHRSDVSAMSSTMRNEWIRQRGNQEGQSTLNVLQAFHKCCGFNDDNDNPQQPCARVNPGKPSPGCGPKLVARAQLDLLKTGLLLLFSSLVYIFGMVTALKMTKQRVWSGEHAMKQKSYEKPADSI